MSAPAPHPSIEQRLARVEQALGLADPEPLDLLAECRDLLVEVRDLLREDSEYFKGERAATHRDLDRVVDAWRRAGEEAFESRQSLTDGGKLSGALLGSHGRSVGPDGGERR